MLPPLNQDSSRSVQIILTVFFGLLGTAVIEIARQLNKLGVAFSPRSFWWLVVLIGGAAALAGIVFVWTKWFENVVARLAAFYRDYWPRNMAVLLGAFIITSVGFSAWVMWYSHLVLRGYAVRLLVYFFVTLVGMLLLKPLLPDEKWAMALASSLLFVAAIYKTMAFLPDISTSPFSLGWSEGSRYYYGSLYFSERILGVDLPLSVWHPSRYMLLAIPFAVPGLPIWAHRLWQVLLWIVLPAWSGFLLAKRLQLRAVSRIATFTAWAFLFLLQGPVYYHLLICVMLIYWGVDFKKPARTFWVVMAASVWAGLSRINWVPVPLFLAIVLYFLEVPWAESRARWRYILPPIAWSVGLAAAFLSYSAYIYLSDNVIAKFGSSFTSALLWDRLWPNATYKMGIFGGAMLVSLPLWLIVYFRFRRRFALWHPLKWLGFAAMSLVLFVGGLVVSVKIGGGSNLHNLDAYFVLLMTVAAYLFFGREVYDRDDSRAKRESKMPNLVVAVALVIPILITVRAGGPVQQRDHQMDRRDLQTLQQLVSDTVNHGGEILFIAERQLQIFGLVPEVPFVAEYEKIELMEMAMSGNEIYLNQFYEDISQQRFALIVSDPVQLNLKDSGQAFSEENNIWVERVAIPLSKYYQYAPLGDQKSVFIVTPK